MSSRFNRPRWPWGSPPVCKSAYAGDQPEHTALIDRTLSAFLYYDVFQPSGALPLSDNPCMRPEVADNSWEGDSTGEGYEVSTILHQDPATGIFDLTVTCFVLGLPVGSNFFPMIPIKSLDPFDTGMILTDPNQPGYDIKCRIMM
jgi:hypothetical protein